MRSSSTDTVYFSPGANRPKKKLICCLISKKSIHRFIPHRDTSSEYILATCLVHPDAAPEVHALSLADRDLIFNETRGHNGCYKAAGLYHDFFDLCPPGQKLTIQKSKMRYDLFTLKLSMVPVFLNHLL